ncbi:hypothetical protein LNV08_15970 [Paucibacter sp. TC2R-5]|uniref:hypothetical protein n=1 Tax=Paucibacter sp. TC2R-5 TaxID=2893555 RepID=UPI0021E37057|nr:hypothetical protein [Paucibacter sp. TC2R-5]MCV2360472.1 hypothetical protein [Paucibacter sp. TC2R-5]
MFTRELVELRQRQLALRLRNIELRAEMRAEAQALLKPVGWFGAAGGLAGAAVMAAGLRRPGFFSKVLGFTSLGLRLARLLTALRAKP